MSSYKPQLKNPFAFWQNNLSNKVFLFLILILIFSLITYSISQQTNLPLIGIIKITMPAVIFILIMAIGTQVSLNSFCPYFIELISVKIDMPVNVKIKMHVEMEIIDPKKKSYLKLIYLHTLMFIFIILSWIFLSLIIAILFYLIYGTFDISQVYLNIFN